MSEWLREDGTLLIGVVCDALGGCSAVVYPHELAMGPTITAEGWVTVGGEGEGRRDYCPVHREHAG